MTWDDLVAQPRHRDADGVLIVLEALDDDTGTAVYRRAGESHTVLRPGQLEVRVLDGEMVVEEDEPSVPPPTRARLVAAGVAAAGLAWLATRRRG
jgi:hypothetical protein